VAITVRDDVEWTALTDLMGAPDWVTAAEFATVAARRDHADLVDERLAAWFSGQDADAVVELLADVGVPAASVGSPSLVTDNEQLRFRGYFEPLDHPSSGPCEYPRPPFAPIAGTGGRWLRTPAPTLGQHTAEVLRRLCGVTDEELARLAAGGVIGTRPLGL
jgi:crotonobetainyl-CoA:carnitine CoA-transferase CaiB-like acyl-CoA transferase